MDASPNAIHWQVLSRKKQIRESSWSEWLREHLLSESNTKLQPRQQHTLSGQAITEIESFLREMRITRAEHLPIAARFCRRIGLIEIVNRVVPNNMEVDVGTLIQGMVLDTLAGRSPLYRLVTFFS